MIRYIEFLVLLSGENLKNLKIKDIIFGSIGQVRVRIGFDPKIYGFFEFSLFRVSVKKIVFKTQNFWAGSCWSFKSGQFLTDI